MIQWQLNGWLSLGIHVDWRARRRGDTGMRYGPYVDLHLGFVILSFGVNPQYSNDAALLAIGRGGERG